MPPKISVVMSVFNSSRFLRPAMDSVLAQSFTDFEFIIINDGSTDSSADILAAYHDPRIRIINQSNQGLVVALNVGITAATSPLIARMDADDICLPDRLQRQFDYLQNCPQIALLGAYVETIDEAGRTLAPVLPFPLTHQQLWSQIARRPLVICHPAVMFRRGPAVEIGLYDTAFPIAEDTEFFARFMSKFQAATLPEVVLRYRLVRSGMSSLRKQQGLQNSIMIADMIDHATPGQLMQPTAEQRRLAGIKPNGIDPGITPRDIESAYRLRIGRELLRGGQWSRAAGEYLLAAKNRPLNWHAYAGLAAAALHHGAAKPQDQRPAGLGSGAV